MPGHQSGLLAPQILAKLDPALRQALKSLSYDPSVALPVMIALAGPAGSTGSPDDPRPSREERARLSREREVSFGSEVTDLVRQLASHGATDIQPSWLNRTVAARVSLPGIEAAARRPETRQVLLAVRRPITA